MEIEEEILYQFEVPYPWRNLLRGILYITMGMIIFAIVLGYYLFGTRPLSFILGVSSWVVILMGIYFIMRYILLKIDKIQKPIKITLTKNYIIWVKGRVNQTLYLDDIRDMKVVLTDKKVKIDVNYNREKNTSRGWMIQFRIGSEVEKEYYPKFIREIFIPFKELVEKRIKELNPQVKIEEIDKREKYR